MQQVSNKMEALLSIQPHLSKMQQDVLDALVQGRKTCEQVCDYLTALRGKVVHPHQITPRLGELMKMNKIYIHGTTTARSGRKANVYRAKETIKQYTLFDLLFD